VIGGGERLFLVTASILLEVPIKYVLTFTEFTKVRVEWNQSTLHTKIKGIVDTPVYFSDLPGAMEQPAIHNLTKLLGLMPLT
jgi:hypothetical protein